MRYVLTIYIAAFLSALLSQVVCAESAPESFAYVLQADALAGTKTAAIDRLATCDRDWLVLDSSFSNDTPWERTEVETIRAGRAGRKVIAYLSIGEAEDYRPYWQKEWESHGKLTAAAPAWLGVENPEWKGNYRVKYWDTDWQAIILASVDDAMAHGFDGVYLDIVDGFETFEQDGRRYVDDRINPATKQSFRRDMVDWVKAVAARARAKHPAALVVPQNGSQLLSHPDFLTAISAIGIEDLFTNGKKSQPKSHADEVLGHLKRMAAARKPVLVIEYPTDAALQDRAKQLSKDNQLIWLITDRQLKTLGTSGR